MYLDLHAHAGKKGCFIYGNHFDNLDDQSQAMLFPKLISLNCVNFDYPECNFTEKLMLKKDKKDQSKSREGAGWVAIYKDCNGLFYSYTLECNYACGGKVNPIEQRLDIATKKFILETDPINDPKSSIYRNVVNENGEICIKFNSRICWDIGKACLISILDMCEKNPCPRIMGKYGLKMIKSDIMQELAM